MATYRVAVSLNRIGSNYYKSKRTRETDTDDNEGTKYRELQTGIITVFNLWMQKHFFFCI